MTAGLKTGRYIFGCAAAVLTADEKAFFKDSNPFGFILFARNIETPTQVASLCASLRDAVGWDVPIFIDQEGGRVARMRAPHWPEYPPALDMAGWRHAERAFYLRGALIAEDLLNVGINGNCTPLADVARDETHAVLKNRCFGTTPEDVITNARAMRQGQSDMGVLSVLKHMPGHGRATLDSHLNLPRVTTAAAELAETDFAAFRALADTPLGMTAHIVFEDLDPDHPATQSTTLINLIREDIGFGGVLMTDDISMEALDGDVRARSVASYAAGCDLVLHCNGQLDEMRQVADCAPHWPDRAQDRVNTALTLPKPKPDIDIAALREEFSALVR